MRSSEQVTKLLSATLTNDSTEATQTIARPNIGNWTALDVYMHSLLSHILIVIKAERTPIQYGSVDTVYIFPDENDNLTNYTGGNAQVMVPNGLLQGNVKFDDTQNTFTTIYIHILCKLQFLFLCDYHHFLYSFQYP